MAEFCQQCSIELFGEDFGDLAKLGGEDSVLQPGEGYAVICEGCGPTLVNNEGVCITDDCMRQHGKQETSNGS